MATAAISILDRLIQLATVRERNREKFFSNFIHPLYADAEQIAKDYLSLTTELAHRIEQAKSWREISEWLEIRRASFQPLRIKVRALMLEGFLQRRGKSPNDAFALFQKGVWGLMKGGVSAVEDGRAITPEYGYGDHTVLDILRAVKFELNDENLRWLAGRAHRQRRAIEAAWEDVTKAYAEVRATYLR